MTKSNKMSTKEHIRLKHDSISYSPGHGDSINVWISREFMKTCDYESFTNLVKNGREENVNFMIDIDALAILIDRIAKLEKEAFTQ
jgi:hypothetical protein